MLLEQNEACQGSEMFTKLFKVTRLLHGGCYLMLCYVDASQICDLMSEK